MKETKLKDKIEKMEKSLQEQEKKEIYQEIQGKDKQEKISHEREEDRSKNIASDLRKIFLFFLFLALLKTLATIF